MNGSSSLAGTLSESELLWECPRVAAGGIVEDTIAWPPVQVADALLSVGRPASVGEHHEEHVEAAAPEIQADHLRGHAGVVGA